MDDEERLKQIELLIKELEDSSISGATIVVEGRKDRRALRDLGIEGEVIFASRSPLFQLSERAANNSEEIVVMTDWDRKGDMLARRMSNYLTALGHPPNLRIRSRLGSLVKKDVKEVENLPGYIAKLRLQCGVDSERATTNY